MCIKREYRSLLIDVKAEYVAQIIKILTKLCGIKRQYTRMKKQEESSWSQAPHMTYWHTGRTNQFTKMTCEMCTLPAPVMVCFKIKIESVTCMQKTTMLPNMQWSSYSRLLHETEQRSYGLESLTARISILPSSENIPCKKQNKKKTLVMKCSGALKFADCKFLEKASLSRVVEIQGM